MRFVSGKTAAAEAEESFGSSFGAAGLQGGPEGGWDGEHRGGGLGSGGGGGWDEEEMDRERGGGGGGGGGTMAERMMAKMGYVPGGGLGKHGEGRAEAIVDRGNVGALGLGYAVKGLT